MKERYVAFKGLATNKLWTTGMILFISGNVLNFLSFGFAPQTLLAGLSSIQFVTNIFFSWYIFGDPLTIVVICGTVFIILGNVFVVIQSAGSSTVLDSSEFLDLFTNYAFLIYFFLVVFIAIGLEFYFKNILPSRLNAHLKLNAENVDVEVCDNPCEEDGPHHVSFSSNGPTPHLFSSRVEQEDSKNIDHDSKNEEDFAPKSKSPELYRELSAQHVCEDNKDILMDVAENEKEGVLDIESLASPQQSFTSMVMLSTKLSEQVFGKAGPKDSSCKDRVVSKKEWKALPVLYAAQSAMLGCFSVLLAKSLSTLLRASVTGDNQFGNYVLYLVLFTWLGFMIFWLKRMNKSLQMFDGVIIIPTLQVFWITFSILSGGIFFQEFSGYSAKRVVGFIFSVLAILFGVVLLTNRKRQVKARPEGKELKRVNLDLCRVASVSKSRKDLFLVERVTLACHLTEEDLSPIEEDEKENSFVPAEGA